MTLREYITELQSFAEKNDALDIEVGCTSVVSPTGFKTPLSEVRYKRVPAADSNILEFEQNKIKGVWQKFHRPSEKGDKIVFIW